MKLNAAAREDLLRVPGFGPATVTRILSLRKQGEPIRSLHDLGKLGKRLQKSPPDTSCSK